MKARRLAILCTHPIQYHSGWFKAVAAQPKIDLEVLFCRTATSAEQAAAGFAVEFDWDVALLDGYQYRFLKNIARNPSVARFSGLDTPELLSVIERETFDAVIIIGWHYKSAWQALWACWKTKTPVMMRSDSNLHTERSLDLLCEATFTLNVASQRRSLRNRSIVGSFRSSMRVCRSAHGHAITFYT